MDTLIHEQIYRGEKLLAKMAERQLFVCGAGAVGSNLVMNLARQGFKKITVVDMDRVEDHNRNTQIWTKRDIGAQKVVALRSHVYNGIGVSIEPLAKKLDQSNIFKCLKDKPLVIDGFDNSESRKIITNYCRDMGIECLHVGLSKDYAEVIWNDNYHVPKDVVGLDVCEYPLARNIVMLAVAVASETLIRFVDTGSKRSYSMTLGDFQIRLMEEGTPILPTGIKRKITL